MKKEIKTLTKLAKRDVQGALLLAISSNVMADFVESLPSDILQKINPNIR